MTCPRCGLEPAEHPAGRCLDAWVAEAVMGWQNLTTYTMFGFQPSTHIQDAWEVVEKLKEQEYSFGLEMTNNITDDGQLKDGWEAYFCDDDYSHEAWDEDEKVAICRAAILASIPAASNEAAK